MEGTGSAHEFRERSRATTGCFGARRSLQGEAGSARGGGTGARGGAGRGGLGDPSSPCARASLLRAPALLVPPRPEAKQLCSSRGWTDLSRAESARPWTCWFACCRRSCCWARSRTTAPGESLPGGPGTMWGVRNSSFGGHPRWGRVRSCQDP